MRLAWLAAAAVGIVAVGACFSPSIPQGQRCTASGECPGDLECIEGFCCSSAAECPSASDDAGAPDSGVDARQAAFTDFGPYTCDTNTEMLLHLDAADPVDEPCPNQTDVNVVAVATTEESIFEQGIDFNRSQSQSEYLNATTDQLSGAGTAYTVDVWVQTPTAPSGDNVAVIASAATFNGIQAEDARFVLGLDSQRRVRLDLFGGALCQTQLSEIITSTDTVAVVEPTHIRATVTQTEAQLFINGFAQPAQSLSMPPCTGLSAAQLRVRLSGVRNIATAPTPSDFETTVYRRLEGVLDEFRLSDADRVP